MEGKTTFSLGGEGAYFWCYPAPHSHTYGNLVLSVDCHLLAQRYD